MYVCHVCHYVCGECGDYKLIQFSTLFVHELVCLFLIHNHARASAHAQHVLVFVVSRLSVGNYLDKN